MNERRVVYTDGTRKETLMKAIQYTHYGSPDVLQLKEVEKPVPKDGELLVKVHASSVNAYDRHLMRSKPLLIRIMSGNGLLKPKDQRLGVDLAGRVEAVGSKVTQFQPGDEVVTAARKLSVALHRGPRRPRGRIADALAPRDGREQSTMD